MSKGNTMNKTKKEFAPSVKLYPSRTGKTYTSSISEKSAERINEVLSRAEVGGLIMLKPVSAAYRAKAQESGGTAPEFELVIQTKAEVDAFRASIARDDESL